MAERYYSIDLTFVIGHSTRSKLTEWQFMLEYVNYIVSNVRIGQSAIKGALITYSKESRVAWKLNDYNDRTSLNQVPALCFHLSMFSLILGLFGG